MDHQDPNAAGCYERSYKCTMGNYNDEALFEQDNMPLCYPVLNTAHIGSADRATECPGICDGILDLDSDITSDATHGRGSAPRLFVQQPSASTKHMPWPSDEFAGYGEMERIYNYPSMQQQQLSYSQKEDQQIMATCHYNILEYACGHSTPHPTLPYITHIDTCQYLALSATNMACQNMGIASMSTSTRLCNVCIEIGKKTRIQVEEAEASNKSKTRSDLSMPDMDIKEEEKYKFRWSKRSEAENTEVQKIREAHSDAYNRREDLAREKGTKMSEILRRASALRDSRLKLMQDAALRRNASVFAKSEVNLGSCLPSHHSMRKEGLDDTETKEKWWLQRVHGKEAANTQFGQQKGMEATESEGSKGKSSSKIFSMPKEKADSTNSEDQSKWFGQMWSDLTNSSIPELVDTRLEDKVSADKFSAGVPHRFLASKHSGAVSKSPNMSATEMLKGIHEKDVKLSMTKMATRAPILKPSMFNSSSQKQSTKPSTTSQGSHTQPKTPINVSKSTQTTEDIALPQITQNSVKPVMVSLVTQTDDLPSKFAAQSTPQNQRIKPTMAPFGTQTDELPRVVEMDTAVKGEKETDWEDMDLVKGNDAEDADWEFVNM